MNTNGWKSLPPDPTPEIIGAMAIIEASMTIDGVPCIGMSGAEQAYYAMYAATPLAPVSESKAGIAGIDALLEDLIAGSDGHWKEDVFCIDGGGLMALLRSAAASTSAPTEPPLVPAVAKHEEHLLNLLRASRNWVEQAGTINGYGFYRPENPNDFHPDPESCTEEEMANHKAACEAWDRGDFKAPLGSESFYDEKGELTLHITRAPWGIGSYTDTITEAADLLAAIDCALAPKTGCAA